MIPPDDKTVELCNELIHAKGAHFLALAIGDLAAELKGSNPKIISRLHFHLRARKHQKGVRLWVNT